MNIQVEDEKYMKRCLELAFHGLGCTSPNPMVGSVIVYNHQIIGEGYHYKAGGPHAEVNAIRSVKNKSLLSDSTLYVNLEPCAHMGKTPPCSDLIIEQKIPRIVIGSVDPNSLVAGKGIEKLIKTNREVIVGILEKECMELNRRFFTFHKKHRPYIILKWAQTLDGFIDINRTAENKIHPTWISNEISRMLVHKWRSEEDAIMIGTNTALMDNPKLNTREWSGKSPIRIVVDRNLRLPESLNVFDQTQPTIVYTEKSKSSIPKLEYQKIPFDKNFLEKLTYNLYNREIQSIIIEGGQKLLSFFIKNNYWDEARIFIGNKKFYNGIKAPEILNVHRESKSINEDELFIYKNY